MTQATRARLKPNAIISPIDRPLFDKASIMGRSRRIDTSAEVWQIGETEPVSLNWSALSRFPELLVSEIKYALEFFLEKMSPNTVANFFEILKRLCKSIDEWEDEPSLAQQLSEFVFDFIVSNRNRDDETHLNNLRHWYLRSYHLGLTLFERKTCQVLSKLSFKGNHKGLDVMVYMEGRSPLRSDEMTLLRKSLYECRQRVTPYHPIFPKLVATWLFVVLGVRPKQLLLLMTADFSVNVDEDTGNKTYLLNVPSVKKRHMLPRTQFKSRILPVFLGEMIEQLISVTYGDLFSSQLMAGNEEQLLFIGKNDNGRRNRQATFERFEASPGYSFFHNSPSDVIAFIDEWRVSKGLPALDLKLTPRRLRKTFATHAALMGTPAIALMELLDHEDLQHIMVYYQLGVNFSLRVDAVYKKYFSDHLAFFEGKITLKELVKRKNINTVFGPDSLKKLVGIGLCAKGSPCSLQPPYSCYGCNKFEASNDISVHQEVLMAMQNEVREKFGDDAPPGFYTVPHINACNELVRRLEVDHE
ncbi:tyrosine-type recombinase/integrase [Rheinheimera sp.]|uniref:tyrosine-type recombinase/integrase n=1 Tax=Rheinheimera sp. TaxID=1869214 RepID=UPI0023569DBA|nr:tyrosine-type recombinase/integrase [Rheinheimera sp.]